MTALGGLRGGALHGNRNVAGREGQHIRWVIFGPEFPIERPQLFVRRDQAGHAFSGQNPERQVIQKLAQLAASHARR
jgi:hypothetical protein